MEMYLPYHIQSRRVHLIAYHHHKTLLRREDVEMKDETRSLKEDVNEKTVANSGGVMRKILKREQIRDDTLSMEKDKVVLVDDDFFKGFE